jgi:hypothetical protein
VDVVLPDGDYSVNLIDLFGRVVFANHRPQKGVSGIVSFATNKLSKGVYVVDVLKSARHVQKEVLFVQ